MRALIALAFLLSSFGAHADSLWGAALPGAAYAVVTANPYQLGTEVMADQDGYIIGVRWAKHESETGTHSIAVFSAGGTLLASASATAGETASGWQTALLDTPVAVKANTSYVVVRHYNGGSNSYDYNFAQSFAFTSSHLTGVRHRYLQSSSTTAFPTNIGTANTNLTDVMYVPKARTYILIPNDQ
jgi:hypothetical protein